MRSDSGGGTKCRIWYDDGVAGDDLLYAGPAAAGNIYAYYITKLRSLLQQYACDQCYFNLQDHITYISIYN